MSREDMEFCALARNAFDVMMRRGWGVRYSRASGLQGDTVPSGWEATVSGEATGPLNRFPDPFTALVEADRWYAANVEKKEG